MRSTCGPAAAALIVVAAVLASCGAHAIEPETVPEAIGWRLEPHVSLARAPLHALERAPAAFTEAEWAPLYDGGDGARVESARRTFGLRAPARALRLGLELDARLATVRGGDATPWLGVERVRSTRVVAGAAANGARFAAAAAAMRDHDRFGFAAEGRAAIGARARLTAGWSRAPEAGRFAALWDELDVHAAGRWVDQRVAWRLEAPLGAGTLALGQEALDRRPDGRIGAARDGLRPEVAWRASSLEGALDAHGARWTAALHYGEGRERFQLWRGAAPYGTVAGRVFNAFGSGGWTPQRWRVEARAWAGRWSGDARGAVALWPFDPLAALAGTRRVARSSGSLGHAGVAVDRPPETRTGLDGGVALCRMAPRARYESWEAALLGQGRDDESAASASLRAAWLAGVRLAATLEALGVRARLELVQWAPLRVERVPSDPPAGGGGDPGGGSGGGAGGGDRGGTVIRVAIQSLR